MDEGIKVRYNNAFHHAVNVSIYSDDVLDVAIYHTIGRYEKENWNLDKKTKKRKPLILSRSNVRQDYVIFQRFVNIYLRYIIY